MKQKYVQFHTSKSYKETLDIFKKEKIEIIFRSASANIYFADLTVEEQISWIETREKYLKYCDQFLKKYNGQFENLYQNVISFRTLTKELITSYRTNPSSYKTSEKYEQFNKKREQLSKIDYNAMYNVWTLYFRNNPFVYCSCIIAKKGTNYVRYLSFRKDPIVTIIGSKSTDLKLTLEKKF